MMGRSTYTLRELAAAVREAGVRLANVSEQLAIATELPRGEIDRAVESALEAGRQLREALSNAADALGQDRPTWVDPESLTALVETLAGGVERREMEGQRKRLAELAGELRGGSVVCTKALHRAKAEELRAKAVKEVEASGAYAVSFPWPATDVESLVKWFAAEEGIGDRVANAFPLFAEFLAWLDPAWWKPPVRSAHADSGSDDTAGPPALLASALTREAPQPHRLDVKQAKQSLRAETTSLVASLTAPSENEEDHVASKEGPRFAAPGALAMSSDEWRPPRKMLSGGRVIAELEAPRNPGPSVVGTAVPVRTDHSSKPDESASVGPIPTAWERPSTEHDSTLAMPLSRPDGRDSVEFPISSESPASLREPAKSLPQELTSLAHFRNAYWRDGRGDVVPAPWTDRERFGRQLETAADEAMRDGRFGLLILFARAAEVIGSRRCPAPEEARVLASLLAGSRAVPFDAEGRRSRLRDLGAHAELRESVAARVTLFLEALTQSPSAPLPTSEGREFAESAGFSPTMVQVLEGLLTVGSVEDEPISWLRTALQHVPKKSAEELVAAVSNAEANLRHGIKTLWSAAGGKIERTHCREAWQGFMTRAQTVFNELLENASWDDVKRLDGLLGDHTRIADKFGVKFSDRHRMDRAAGELVGKARMVVAARREASRRSRAVQGRGQAELVEAYQKLMSSPSSPSDGCFTVVLKRIVDCPESSVDETTTSIPLAEFHRRPALLETLPTLSLAEDRAVDAASVGDPRSAAAHFIFDEEERSDGRQSLSRHLRELGREDLLVHVVPRSDTDAKFAADALGKAQAQATRILAEARAAAVAVEGLAHPAAPAVSAAVDEAEEMVVNGPVHEEKPEFLLAWLSKVRGFARDVLEDSIPALREDFERRNPTSDEIGRFNQALAQQQYADILALARGEAEALPIEDRATRWRLHAAAEFPDARRTLRDLRTRHDELCRLWLAGISDPASDGALRSEFVKFVFDTITQSKNNIKESKSRPETQVNMTAVRASISAHGLNPSFVPQVTMFREISIVTPSSPPTATMFVRSTTELLAKATDGKMTVLLSPGISSTVREQLRDELRRRSSKGVGIVDDLDLVRLLNPGRQEVNPILALLEIVLEQQAKWSQISPFESHEGQHTKPEMFVGRREEAEDLSQRALYSRVFSGRRLGKSALLKHVCDSQDNRAKLPSGNRLRVIYVPIVGLDAEDAVVRKIIEAFPPGLALPSLDAPADRLKLVIDSYLRKERSGSVLVFLDESDTFVEAQIRQYEEKREQSLTWRMRSELEAEHDSQGLPRVRFVFAGYRATHRREGAWANWNDVLRLRPLSRTDAARLVAGPLGRLGINATSEAAAIAYRCGYQPAILVRFGQHLIEHLDNTLTPARRDSVVVTPEQVATVYQSAAVQQEIRTIVWNNFQGNPFGQIIFSALLLEFARMPPAAALDDAPSRVLQRLRELVPSFMADDSIDGPAVDRIARTLRDFGDRSLIDEVHPTTRSYRLKFPHQLNVLLQEDQSAIIRREAAALGGERVDAIEDVRSLVARGALEDLGYALSNEGFVGAVVASQWLEAVERRAANVAARLGYMDGEIVDLFSDPNEIDLRRRRLALLKASPEAAARSLRERGDGGDRPLFIGGLDLMRWALRRWRENREIELATVPRISAVQLRWWFERVCEINWAGANPLPRFMQRTAGVPYLVARLDDELGKIVGLDGASASEVHIAQALERFDNSLERAGRELVLGSDPTISLERREQELLVMVARASEIAFDSSTPRSDLLEILLDPTSFGSFFPKLPSFKPLTPDDALALDVLLRSGLLPSESKAGSSDPFERLQPLPQDDPIIRISAVVEGCLST